MGRFRNRKRRAEARVGLALVLLCVTTLPFLSACAGGSDTTRSGGAALAGSLHVLVAASLLPVAEALADDFERTHSNVDVLISGAGSSALREQVLAGAPADVFIPADPVHLDVISDEVGLVGAPVVVARNSLVLAVPTGNEAGVTSLADLSRPELLIGLCAADVPCGAHARSGLAEAGIEPAPDTDEPNVRALVSKLAAGELDAAVVYASDASARFGASDDGTAIISLGWTAGTAPRTSYVAAVLADAPNLVAAQAFVEFLLTETARTAFADHGFAAP